MKKITDIELFDYDYQSAIDLFSFQLEKIANFMESEKALSVDSKSNSRRIRTAIELMNRVYSEYYSNEYFDYEDKLSKEDYDKMRKKCIEKQERAHKLLWDFIAHNIRNWWD